jgi:pilus assembly protein CpaF
MTSNAAELITEVEKISSAFSQSWSFDGRDLERPSVDQMLKDLIAKSPESLRERLFVEYFQLGPIAALVSDPLVREIVINGPDEIWFEQNGKFERLNDRFLSQITFKNFVDRICGQSGIKVDLAHPFVDGRWGEFRVHIGCAPMTHCDYHITLRRLSNDQWTLNRLAELNWASEKQLELLKKLITQRKNLIFIGPTGCGKTTALSACLSTLSDNERVVLIEDTDELPRPNSASSKLLTRPMASSLAEVTLTDLVRQSLRMRPERLVLGEVRGGEAKDLLMALATGHSGSFGTLHASDAKQALLRLEMLVQLGAPQWNVQAIRQLILFSLNGLVVCGIHNGQRRLEGIYRVAALESFGFLLEPWPDDLV